MRVGNWQGAIGKEDRSRDMIALTYAMVRLKVVDLFPKYQNPNILAQELDHIQRVRE